MSKTPYQYPTSIAVPGEPLEQIRDAKFIASNVQIEVLHIMVFVGLLAFIFGKAWKVAQSLKKPSKATVAAGSLKQA